MTMKTVAFFNNKRGVGATSLVYHLAWMLSEMDYRVLGVDLDPQANLSRIFLPERRLEELWEDRDGKTIEKNIAPLFEGTGDIDPPHVEKIGERIGLLTGDLALSKREDELSAQWPKCLDGDRRAFRVITAFARSISRATKAFEADLALVDVGPNLGAINRAALIASDAVVVPLAPDLFSLQGLRSVGPTLKAWRKAWKDRVQKKPPGLEFDLPEGNMAPLGYIVMRQAVRLDRPVTAYGRWIQKMPLEYARSVLENESAVAIQGDDDSNRLADLKDYRALMPMAQEANKPMFMLKPAHGVIGAHQNAAQNCYKDFNKLARTIFDRLGIEKKMMIFSGGSATLWGDGGYARGG